MLFNPTRQQERNIRKWIKALRSGKFIQTRSTLERTDHEGKKAHCCFGVACRVIPKMVSAEVQIPYSHDVSLGNRTKFTFIDGQILSGALSSAVLDKFFGFLPTDQDELINWNDFPDTSFFEDPDFRFSRGRFERATFAEIADMLEDYLIACEVLNSD